MRWSRNAAAIVFTAVLVAVLSLLLARLESPSPTSSPESVEPAGSRAPSLAQEPTENDADPARIAEVGGEGPRGKIRPPGTGRLLLVFVSAVDASPVPDLPFQVWRERGGDRVLARGRSDGQGKAEVSDLEENVILVETARRPPFASRVAGCWLSSGETKELVVRLDAGARVVGRAVDVLGRPIAGAQVIVTADFVSLEPADPLDRELVAATSDAEGRFAVDAMASRPRGVWIVDGEMRPERFEAAELFVRVGCAITRKVPDVRPGTTFDLGDVIVPRCATIAGRVEDSEGRPAPGALVSWRQERKLLRRFPASRSPFRFGPSDPEFRLRAGETLTDAAGRFAIDRPETARELSVWAASGQRQEFPFPEVGPEELVLRLDAIAMLEVELLDASGARVRTPGPAAREKHLVLAGGPDRWDLMGAAVAIVRLDDGGRETIRAGADPDGLYRFEVRASPRAVDSLSIRLAGYQDVEDRIAGRVEPITRLSYALRETPALRLRVSDTGSEPPAEMFVVQICLAPPDRRTSEWECCGLGAWVWVESAELPRDLLVPALARRPYWVYLRSRVVGSDDAAFGPFEPGDEVREIAADLGRMKPREEEEERSPPPPLEPGEPLAWASVTARAVDARTGSSIEDLWLTGDRFVDDRKTHSVTSHSLEGPMRIRSGLWTFTVSAEGYRGASIPKVSIAEGEVEDLGEISLDPLPGIRLRVVEGDDRPVAGAWVGIVGSDPEDTAWATTDAEGRATLHSEVADGAFLETAGRRVVVSEWDRGGETLVRLAYPREVEVRVGGAALDPSGARLILGACPAVGEPTAACDHRDPELAAHGALARAEEREPTPTRRVYRLRLPAGKHQVFGKGLLHEVPVQEIEVRDADGLQVFELLSR